MQVEIVGGGMVGLAFAIAVKRALPEAGVRVMEARAFPAGSPQALDSRATALNLASRDILHSWGIWEQLEQSTAEIESIHVSRVALAVHSWRLGTSEKRLWAM